MLIDGPVAWFIGIDAERQSLEDIADPVTSTKRRGSMQIEGTTGSRA